METPSVIAKSAKIINQVSSTAEAVSGHRLSSEGNLPPQSTVRLLLNGGTRKDGRADAKLPGLFAIRTAAAAVAPRATHLEYLPAGLMDVRVGRTGLRVRTHDFGECHCFTTAGSCAVAAVIRRATKATPLTRQELTSALVLARRVGTAVIVQPMVNSPERTNDNV